MTKLSARSSARHDRPVPSRGRRPRDGRADRPRVDVREAGALDGLTRPEIDKLAPTGSDEILVTRLRDGVAVFVGKEKIVGLVEQRIAALEQSGATMTALLCTGAFPRLRSSRTLIQPHPCCWARCAGSPGPVGSACSRRRCRTCRRPRRAGAVTASIRSWRRCRLTKKRTRPRCAAPPRRCAPAAPAGGDGLHGLSPQDARRASRAHRRAVLSPISWWPGSSPRRAVAEAP